MMGFWEIVVCFISIFMFNLYESWMHISEGCVCEPSSFLRRAWLYPYLCAWTLGLNKIHTFAGTIHASFLRKMWPLLSYRNSGCREFCLGCSTPLKELWPAPPTSPQSAWGSSPPAVNHCPFSVLWWGSVTAAFFPPFLNTSFHISKSYCFISSPACLAAKRVLMDVETWIFASCFGCCYLSSFSTTSRKTEQRIWVDKPTWSPFSPLLLLYANCYSYCRSNPEAEEHHEVSQVTQAFVSLQHVLKMFSFTYSN